MKKLKRITFAAVLFLMISIMSSFITAYADDSIHIGVNVANKIDVALAIGPTTVDYSTFEADLRADLYKRNPAVAPDDLYVTAARAVSANTTSEFSWWVYDHTKPSSTSTIKAADGQSYGGIRNVSDTTNTYIECDLGNTTTGSSQGTINRDPGSVTYTPDANNKDIGSTRHPYQGIQSHMIESDNGATMDFYGYAHDSYKDFRFLPNNQATKKVFEFAIQEDVAYDALDGVGFFFNTDITGSYEAKTQTMSGYLLFLGYNSSGKGANITIYKFQNVNTYRFHQSMNSTTATATTAYTIANYAEGSDIKFVQVSQSTVYTSTDKYRRIKLEVYPTYISVYYNGSASNTAVLTTPIAQGATPVDFTKGTAGTQIPLDSNYIKSYGFGPMASYISHTCARPTHLALQNLSMEVDKVRSLSEVVREPEWHQNTLKYLINLNENEIEDFSNTSITGELLNRLRNDDIYYIGWCSDTNAKPSEEFLQKNDLKGHIVNIENSDTKTYQKQIKAIADEIYKRYWYSNDDDIVLTTDQVVLNVSGAQQIDSADLEWPDGKWKIVHYINSEDGLYQEPEGSLGYFDNDEGIHPLSGQYLSDLDIQFNKPGYYDLYYRNQYIKTIIAHRPPVAAFNINLNDDNPTFNNVSYDPDDPQGIVSFVWSYMDIETDVIPKPNDLPDALIEGHTYLVALSVTDKYGATTIISKQIRYVTNEDPEPQKIEAPFSEFNITPNTILKAVGNQDITLVNTSYDLQGLNITSTFKLTRNGVPVEFSFVEGVNDVSTLDVGNYILTLVVNNGVHDSVEVSRSFSIIEDTISPTATATISTGDFTTNTPVTITFSDIGGSLFKNQRFIITNSASTPDSDNPLWSNYSYSNSRIITINMVGTSYIHWEATDYAGNKSAGYFGPYKLSKQDIEITLTVSPESSVVHPASITLTATFNVGDNAPPSGTVFFLIDNNTIGSATIAGNQASFTYTPPSASKAVYSGDVTLKAYFGGDSTYNVADASLSYLINKNSTATVTVGNQTNKYYDTTPFIYSNITVTGANSYKIEYEGRDGTIYPLSNTAPTDVGKYTIIVTTDDSGYEEKSGSANFEIYKGNQKPLYIKSDITLTYSTGIYTFTADGGTTGGAVTYTIIGGTGKGSIDGGGILTVTKAGMFIVEAVMAGNSQYNPVTSGQFTLTVNKATQTATVDAPEEKSKTDRRVTLIANADMEFSLDGETWQDSNIFEGLTPDTTYYFYQRLRTTDLYSASAKSPALQIITDIYFIIGNSGENVPNDYELPTALFNDYVAGNQLPKPPAPDGYTFNGWLDADGKSIDSIDEINGDISITAVWLLNAPVITILTSENPEGGKTLTANHTTYSDINYSYQWYVKNGNSWTIVSGATNKTFNTADSGEYKCEVRAAAGSLSATGSKTTTIDSYSWWWLWLLLGIICGTITAILMWNLWIKKENNVKEKN